MKTITSEQRKKAFIGRTNVRKYSPGGYVIYYVGTNNIATLNEDLREPKKFPSRTAAKEWLNDNWKLLINV